MGKWLKIALNLILLVILASASRVAIKEFIGPGILTLVSDFVFIMLGVRVLKKYGVFK